ncbi:MAG TPA: enoyl-CoA hydratase/isomerase family protein [Casimicrobiaceae bacterium]
MTALLTSERVNRVAVVTLARPPVNALNDELIASLEGALGEALADADVAVLHLRSHQKSFCAGADLAAMRSCFATPAGTEAMIATVQRMQRLFQRLEAAPVVTIAEIGGAAVGGGLELALACDLRVAAAEARLGLTEAGLGLLPAAGGTQRLTRLCGPAVAKRLILGAELVGGTEAQRLGLVQWAQPQERLAAWTSDLAARIAAMPRAALIAIKRCVAAQSDPGRDGFAEEIEATRALYNDPETRRRVSEFLSKKSTPEHTKELR